MSFLRGRANDGSSSSSAAARHHPLATTSSTRNSEGDALFDADEEEDDEGGRGYSSARRHNEADDDHDDELEAAFGGGEPQQDDERSHRRQQGYSVDSDHQQSRHGGDQSFASIGSRVHDREDDDEEQQQLLSGSGGNAIASGSGSGSGSHSPHRPAYPRAASSATTLNPGGYDFEADPYDRRGASSSSTAAAASASTFSLHENVRPAMGRSRHRRSGSGSGAGAQSAPPRGGVAGVFDGLLSTVRSNLPLPARFRQYGRLGASRNDRGRRADGTTDAGDEDDEEDDDNWIMPPQSRPGLFGGGTKFDGVFSNMTAKPGGSTSSTGGRRGEMVGGDDEAPEKEIPPAYDMAVLDAAPPYFDTTVHTSAGPGALGGVGGTGLEDILIEGLPLGNIFSFCWSLLVSMSFQFVGFLLTTLLSTSHAAKNGSRAGLGVTLIQYGLYLGQELEDNNQFMGDLSSGDQGKEDWAAFWGGGANSTATPTSTATGALQSMSGAVGNGTWDGPNLVEPGLGGAGVSSSWLSMMLMIGGWFLLVSSVVAYLKAIRYAKALRDGVSEDSTSAGFAISAWLSRVLSRMTGKDISLPTFGEFGTQPRERVWGLHARPAPRVPDDDTRPQATGEGAGRSNYAWLRSPGPAGIQSV